jgi:hypothetical protein
VPIHWCSPGIESERAGFQTRIQFFRRAFLVRLTYLSRLRIIGIMKPDSVRTSIDLPCELHRRVHEAAARKGCSARKLILAGIERAVEEAKSTRPSRRLSLDPPLIRPAGRRIRITDEQAYELIELP